MYFLKRTLFFSATLHRRFSTSPAISAGRNKPFQYVRMVHRAKFIDEAQKSIRNYLHQTTSLPFVYAEQIAQNSPFCLSNFLRKINLSAPNFASNIDKAFSSEPINEFEFFLESIGVDRDDLSRFLPPRKFFFSEDTAVLEAACELFRFGFPWNKIGKLYVEDVSIFCNSPEVLDRRLGALRDQFGGDNLFVVGACLAFPRFLSIARAEFDEGEQRFRILKMYFEKLGLESGVIESNVDAWYEVCCKVRFFYDSGCDKQKVEKLLGKMKVEFFTCPTNVMLKKFDYFAKFDASKLNVATFLLRNSEILSLDLETQAMNVLGFLEHLGLGSEELKRVCEKYPYVLGRNKMANLPCAMKALDLHEWCFKKIKSSKGQLLATYSAGSPEEGSDEGFVEGWKRIESSKNVKHAWMKLNFLKEIGFGENGATIRTLDILQGKRDELRKKFDFLLGLRIKHSEACYMMRRSPQMFAQSLEKLEKKTEYCLREMGCSVDFVVNYPDFYTLDLELRLKRRHQFYMWLQDRGCQSRYSLSGMLQISDKRFVTRLYRIHPAAPKHYLECF